MGQYDDMIKINITEAAQGVSITGFGTVLILTADATFSPRTKAYSSAGSALAADLTGGSSSIAYKMAQAIFSQNPAPSIIKIGKVGYGEGLDDAIDAIVDEDDDWYLCVTPDRTAVDIEDLAAKIEELTKLMIYSSDDSNILLTPDTTSLPSLFKGLYNRTCGFYHDLAATQYLDGAVAGYLGAKSKPGSYSLFGKTLAAITPDVLTPAEEIIVLGTVADPTSGKMCNTYETVGGAGRIRYGKVASGKYVDYIIFKDWLTARLQEGVFSLFASVPKVPGDIHGATMIQNAMEPVFKLGQANNAITQYSQDSDKKQNGGYFINLPDMSLRSASDKAARHLSGITFGCWYTDGIHTVEIDGVIL
jgi:hypothetical protein